MARPLSVLTISSMFWICEQLVKLQSAVAGRTACGCRLQAESTASAIGSLESGAGELLFGAFYGFLYNYFRFSVAVERDGRELEQRGSHQPNLPMREKAVSDRKLAREFEVRREPPECQNQGHDCGGRDESGEGQCDVLILTVFPP
jgi:hypothetical protein